MLSTKSLAWLFISALILISLILGIKNSRRFNCYDRILHHKLVKQNTNRLWDVITIVNEPKVIAAWDVVCAGFLATLGHQWAAIWMLATLFFTDSLGIFLKHSIKRKRPLVPTRNRPGYSFPSGHVLSATIMSLMLWRLLGQTLGLLFFIVLLITWLLVVISRLNMKAHYPSDVLGATSLAILCFSIAQPFL